MIAEVNVLILGLIVGNVLFTLFRPRQGVAAYLLLGLVAPHFHLGGTAISYEILGFLPVGGAAFYRNGFRFQLKAEHWLWFVYFICATAATVFSVYRFTTGVRWIAMFGWVRSFFLFVLISTMLSRKGMFRVLSAAVVINLIVAAAQLFIPGAIETTHALYAKESMEVLGRYLERGYIPRAPGTLGSPVNLGAFALLTFAVSYERILRHGYGKVPLFIAVASVIAGVLALSKTAIFGIPLVMALVLMLRFMQKVATGFRVVPRRLLRATTITAVGGGGVWYLIQILNEAGFRIIYHLRFFLKPLEAFEKRYSGEGSGMGKTIELSMENWASGFGFTAPYGEFLGDSAYILIFHTAGVWGIIILLFILSLSVRRAIVRSNKNIIIVISALAMTGFALPVLFNIYGALILAYAIDQQ